MKKRLSFQDLYRKIPFEKDGHTLYKIEDNNGNIAVISTKEGLLLAEEPLIWNVREENLKQFKSELRKIKVKFKNSKKELFREADAKMNRLYHSNRGRIFKIYEMYYDNNNNEIIEKIKVLLNEYRYKVYETEKIEDEKFNRKVKVLI